jgi:methylated-DNA-[protein]-cysteine S-methyltransferase
MDRYVFSTPFSYLMAEASENGLTALHIMKTKPATREHTSTRHPILIDTRKQVMEYFDLKRKIFDIPLDWSGATEFYRLVWNILISIPYGKTKSYGEIARALGDIKKSRAVGLANGRNPIAIIVPCHRVIGSDGSLTGYAGGMEMKYKLLKLENPAQWVQQGNLF